MNAKQKLHQVRLQEWAGRFAEQKTSGLTVRQWCEVNHFSFHTYNYWKHLLKEEVVDQVLPDIVPIPVSAVPEYQSSLEATEVRSIRCRISFIHCSHSWIMPMHSFLIRIVRSNFSQNRSAL